jgi:hypothetical protein
LSASKPAGFEVPGGATEDQWTWIRAVELPDARTRAKIGPASGPEKYAGSKTAVSSGRALEAGPASTSQTTQAATIAANTRRSRVRGAVIVSDCPGTCTPMTA